MAGNAQGIAKARAARAAKAAQRRAINSTVQQFEQSQQGGIIEPLETVGGSVRTVPDAPAEIPQQGQRLADILIDQLQPVAVRELAAALGNRTSQTLRFTAACKIVDLGQAAKAARQKSRAPEEGEDVLIARLYRAHELRTRAASASDLTPIREDSVVADQPPQSHKQPDSQSD